MILMNQKWSLYGLKPSVDKITKTNVTLHERRKMINKPLPPQLVKIKNGPCNPKQSSKSNNNNNNNNGNGDEEVSGSGSKHKDPERKIMLMTKQNPKDFASL